MNTQNLISMANQIGTFFESMPDKKEATEGVATHIRKFWDPRMRRQFLTALEGDTSYELKDIVRNAVQNHRSLFL